MNERNEYMTMLYDSVKKLPLRGLVTMPESMQYLAKTLTEQSYAVTRTCADRTESARAVEIAEEKR